MQFGYARVSTHIAPFAGARIETELSTAQEGVNRKSLPSRGRGLKQ